METDKAAPAVHMKWYRQLVQALTGSPIRIGNKIEILTNGDEIFPSMLEAIASAKETINFVTYVYWRGQTADAFAEALSERARRGVEVNVLLDAFGAFKMDPRRVRYLRRAGVHVAWFRPFGLVNILRYNNRTHRKILVIDGQIGFTGGVGVADEWRGHAQDNKHWRDTHFRVEGPAVLDLVGAFMDNWVEVTGAILSPAHFTRNKGFKDGIEVQITASEASKGNTDVEKLFLAAINSAKRNIFITTAYFSPGRRIVEALVAAQERGVRVKILTNGRHTNHWVARKAGHSLYESILRNDIRLFEYEKTLLHAKVMTVDEQWATVGSANFDDRSFTLNDELNMSFFDARLVLKLDKQFALDLNDSREITLALWRRRGPHKRLTEFLVSWFRHQV